MSILPHDSPDPAREIEPYPPRPGRGLPEVLGPRVVAIDLYGALLADSNTPNTRAARLWDMHCLGLYLGVDGPSAASLLCGGTEGQANAIALGFRSHMIALGQASGTINRRLCTVRRLCKLARRLGSIAWTLDVDNMREEPSRDMAGPTHDGWRKILEVATSRAKAGSWIGVRDLAVIRLMHDAGLRCGEVAALDVEDLDLARMRIFVLGKGRRAKEWITISPQIGAALADWMALLGADSGPVFVRMCAPRADGSWSGNSTATNGRGRISTRSLNRFVIALGQEAGVPVRPHGLRHSGATRLLDITNGNVREVQRWTRHKSVDTVLRYDDARRDIAGDLMKRLGKDD